MPYVDNSGRHQDREQRRAPHLHVLRDEQNLPALDAVGDHAADQREQENGNAAEKLVESEQKRRMAQTIDEPALRHDLHPSANAGRAGAEPHEPEVSILKSLEYPAKS